MTLRLTCLVLFLTTALGCGGKPVNYRPVAIASETFSVALKGLQAQFVVWGDAGTVSRATENEWQASFKQLAQTGLAVDAAIRAGDHASVTANASAALNLVDELIRVNVVKLNPGQRGAVSVALQSIRGFIAIWQAIHPPATAAATLGSRADLVALAEGH